MPRSNAERQADWRNRLTIRSHFFDVLDERRRQLLDLAFMSTLGKPQDIRTIRDFFLAYPLCMAAPAAVMRDEAGVTVTFDDNAAPIERAAALVALDGAAVEGAGPALVDQVRADVEKLRNLGLWRK